MKFITTESSKKRNAPYTPGVAYWDEINVEYVNYFGSHRPARVVVPTGPLHFGSLVEIEAMAVAPEEADIS